MSFPSLAATLNHILWVDLYYIGSLYGERGIRARLLGFEPFDDLASLARHQAESDQRLIAFCDRLDTAVLDAAVEMERAEHRIKWMLDGSRVTTGGSGCQGGRFEQGHTGTVFGQHRRSRAADDPAANDHHLAPAHPPILAGYHRSSP